MEDSQPAGQELVAPSKLRPSPAHPLKAEREACPARDRRLAHALIRWFETHARDLPWRRTRDPYAIWISEVMLQQTQVGTVLAYWKRWMQALPDVRALAVAPLDQVLKLWEGLGYYRRARHLHAAACWIMEHRDGQPPLNREDWLELPGIGPYTAGAIASIAFNEPAPIVDGNIVRVIARLHAWDEPASSASLRKQVWGRAGELVGAAARLPPKHGNRFPPCSALNQALMELGATVCTPRNPRCPACPLRRQCEAHRLGQPDRFPAAGQRPVIVKKRLAVIILEARRRFLVQQRPPGAHNAGLWEFPQHPYVGAIQDGVVQAARELGLNPTCLRPRGTIRHTITRHQLALAVFQTRLPRRPARSRGRWVTRAELHELAFSAAHRRMIQRFLGNDRP